MTDAHRRLLALAMRWQARGGAHAELARQVVLWVLYAEALAAAGHAGRPHRAWSVPRSDRTPAGHRHLRDSLAGRRPRG